ncbi:YqaE/Pmp3 family membrane protein [Rhodopila sp.]|uniref:YqaE/Pmp3 family membrane protein n=1 Tax=Rhodopila sp. TaxID=2480087 RepID=UPI003D097EF2
MIAVAVLLPWLALLLSRRFFQALLCLGLQLTVLGWIPAAIWAVLVVNDDKRDRQYREMLRVLRGR